MTATYKVVFVLVGLIQVITALSWTSQAVLRDGTTIPACGGQSIDLAWTYTAPSSEHVVDIEWYFQADGQSTNKLLATQVNGHFFADPSATHHMQHIVNAGIRLINVTTAQSGVYSVQVNIQGNSQTYSQSVHVVVTAAAITTDGSLHAYLDRPMLMGQEYRLVLKCGTIVSVWDSRVNVIWTTPNGQTLQSTMHENAEFSLAIPNPLIAGKYTCMIDNSSPAKACIPSNSPLLRGATVQVDGTEGRLMLLESRGSNMETQIHVLKSENAILVGQVQTLQHNKTSMAAQIQALQNRESSMAAEIQALQTEKIVMAAQISGLEGTTTNLSRRHTYHTSTLAHHTPTTIGCARARRHPLPGAKGQGSTQRDVGIRLVGGANSHEGRVELRVGSSAYGTVCDDDWDASDAKVACRMLGLPSANAQAFGGAHFGQGNGPIQMDDMNCGGTESRLQDCSFPGFGVHDCSHGEDAGVTCA